MIKNVSKEDLQDVVITIDWKFTSPTNLIVKNRNQEELLKVEVYSKSINAVADLLDLLILKYPNNTIQADLSHPFNNREIEDRGFYIVKVSKA